MTATITILAVVIAYLSDSLDGEFLNELDRMVIDWATRIAREIWASIRRKPTSPAPSKSGSSEAWKEAIQQFILTLSDQQLVTGLAILISGISNQRNLSGYEFSVMLSLAWFSSTTHLATLDALRTYLKTHGAIRNIRVIGMVCILILLVYVFAVTVNTVSIYGEANTVPVQCLFSDPNYVGYAADPLSSMTWSIALLLIISGYVVRIADLYFERGIWSIVSKLMHYWPWKKFASSSLPHSRQIIVQSRTAPEGGGIRRFINKLPSSLQDLLGASNVYGTSFLSSLSGITFSFCYGVSQVSLYRWRLAPPLTSDTNYMGFGQIMAIFLLALPFLSAGETYYGIFFYATSSLPTLIFNSPKAMWRSVPCPRTMACLNSLIVLISKARLPRGPGMAV